MFSSSNLNLVMIGWLLFHLVVGGSNITAAILLLRERHIGAWLMLGGGVLSTIAGAGQCICIMSPRNHDFGGLMSVVSSISALGMLLFVGGLLLYALHRRSLAGRIAELEIILAARDAREAGGEL